ncbi:MAG: hypothetical protein K1X53_15915 [Candidatus Sumerlaeaceae bacterium]|nr:hypothetical protein [Candidatus Sumerlaeaceae bacterium]
MSCIPPPDLVQPPSQQLMNLFEQFWKAIEDRRGPAAQADIPFDLTLTEFHPPEGVQSEAGRDLTSVVRRAARRFPPVVVSQPRFSPRPFCFVYTTSGSRLPEFHELFENYLDKNAFMAETFLRLRPHCEMTYVLFLSEKTFFLFDAELEELLRWGSDFESLEELFLAPVDAGLDVVNAWGQIPRKTLAQRSEEFCRWIDLWKAALGARTNANPAFMVSLMQKVVLLFLFDLNFGLSEPDLRLRNNFLELRPKEKAKASVDPMARLAGFDGIAWLHEASREVCDLYHLDFLFWTQAESNFFNVMGADTRKLFSQFILELFLVSQCKFATAVQSDAFSDPNSRLKLWKFSVTETLNVRKRIQADDVNVYEPLNIDLDESGVGWTLHVIEETLEFWRERCNEFARQLTERKRVKVQFDMFQTADPEHARIPMPEDIFEMAFSTSLRVFYDFPVQRATLEYLIILKVFEFCRRWNIPLQPLDEVAYMFSPKDRMGKVQEI